MLSNYNLSWDLKRNPTCIIKWYLLMTNYTTFFFIVNAFERNSMDLLMISVAKADPGPARRAIAPPPLWKKNGTCFCKFSFFIRTYFVFSQHAVLTICILLKKNQYWKKRGLVIVNFHCIYAHTLILVIMQCLQFVYYSLLF